MPIRAIVDSHSTWINHRGSGQSLEEHPEILDAFVEWLSEWEAWAEREKASKPTRELYQRLYIAREMVAAESQEWELVLGVGRLRWTPADRHVLVQPLRIDLDEQSGALLVTREDPFHSEQDMLSPEQLPGDDATAALRADLGMAFDEEMLEERLTTYTNLLSAGAAFGSPPSDPRSPWVSLDPAIIQRRRSRLGLIDVLKKVADYLCEANEVPEGLVPLVDPNSSAIGSLDKAPIADGAVYWDDKEYFLPLPVNQQQFEVIRRVDHQPLTLVQGPPGTGKTHTTAALISHLLAQGKRILVTAQTEQALHEVRDKLPEEIQELAVAVLGTGQAERTLLTRSVGSIAARAHQYRGNQGGGGGELKELRADLAEAFERRATSRNRLVELRLAEVGPHDISGYHGTRAQIAEQASAHRARFEWALPLLDKVLSPAAPLADAEWTELLTLLRDESFAAQREALSHPLPGVDGLIGPAEFTRLCDDLSAAAERVLSFERVGGVSNLHPLRSCDPSALSSLCADLRDVRSAMGTWAEREEPWIKECLESMVAGKSSVWAARQAAINARLVTAGELEDLMGDEHGIAMEEPKGGQLKVMAEAVLVHVTSGESIKIDALGQPKLGMFTPKALKACAPLFSAVTVEGRPPVTASALKRLIARIELAEVLKGLDVAWPSTVVPPEDTLAEQIAWHRTEALMLDKILAFSDQMDEVAETLKRLGGPRVQWTTTSDVDDILDFSALLDAERLRRAVEQPLEQLVSSLAAFDITTRPSPLARELVLAVRERDGVAYLQGLDKVASLTQLLGRRSRRDELMARLKAAAPRLAEELARSAHEEEWLSRLSAMDGAWRWCRTHSWIERTRPENVNELQTALRDDEDHVREVVCQIAAHLAWTKSVGRLKQNQVSDLVQYTQLVRRLGKGTGKYAARQQQQIREVLTRCTDSVPVWIVPLHRVVTQFEIRPGLFDVVIIDEASQAGLDAAFLQFLGRKIVVVGDDKQVSPTVIIDHAKVHQLADHHLAGSPYKATWSDPGRSLFDEARAKYHDLITLVEHRRCVPDIIGFSNEIAYEPDGIRLIPVRETGSSALDPIVPVFVENGYVEGADSNRRNPPEARAIVEAIKQSIADPRYDGKTMGVISLLGDQQARAIEKILLDEVGPVEIAKRQLRCGVAATFQGAERDVIFLSMVVATEDGTRRFQAQTQESAVQRYNVAVSRAKDQLWIFHSEPLANLSNPEDLRRRLLEYADRVVRRRGSGVPGASVGLVSEDVRVNPFDSLFEQRVHNRVFARGHTLVPQYKAMGYRIDLVVIGKSGKYAIECDGDNWHGPEQYLSDLQRQRELERCGWEFFRLRDSDFIIDPVGSLEPLWPLLDALDRPVEPVVRVAPLPQPVRATATCIAEGVQPLEEELNPPGLKELPPGPHSVPDSALPARKPAVEAEPAKALDLTGLTQLVATLAGGVQLSPYPEWTAQGSQSSVADASIKDLGAALLSIVEVEGPILGDRLAHVCLRAGGGTRLGKSIAARLERVFDMLELRAVIVVDNPTKTHNAMQKTYRTPSQPVVHLRERGTRTLYDIPHMELREVLARVEQSKELEGRELYRAVLGAYALSRLEEKAEAHFARVARLARPAGADVR